MKCAERGGARTGIENRCLKLSTLFKATIVMADKSLLERKNLTLFKN